MLKNSFKLIWRNLWKNANISAINIFGLSVSLAACTLIGLFLLYEVSFDSENLNAENTYRLNTTFKYPNSPERPTAMAAIKMGPYLERESSDIEKYLRVITQNENFICRANNNEVNIRKSVGADTSFFSFFDFPLLYGDKESIFDHVNNIVLAREASEALFGDVNPIGENIEYTYALDPVRDTVEYYMVAGVFDKLPKNSHLNFDAMMPIDQRQYEGWNESGQWHGIVSSTYFQLKENSLNAKEVAQTFPELLKKEMPNSEMVGLDLQPLSEIHLGSSKLEFDEHNFQKSDRKYIQAFGLVALFILLISGVNFANLSTVLAMRRVQEIGVRKSLGASGSSVLFQFLGESTFMAIIGASLAMLWVEILKTPFLSLLGKDIDLNYSPATLMAFGGGVILLGLIAGIFPAQQAANYSAVEAFQNKKTSVSVKRPFIQRLVVLQFMLSGMLIIGSVVAYKQLNFLQTKDLGFKYAQVLELEPGWANFERVGAFKKELLNIPGVIDIAGSNTSIGTISGQNGVLVQKDDGEGFNNFPMANVRVENNYFDLYEMQFVAGQAPTAEAAINESAYVVNESFVKTVGWTGDPIGKEVRLAGLENAGRVVGVIKDVHHNTLHHSIEPICFLASDFSPILSVKINTGEIKSVLAKAENLWAAQIKDRPFEYKFMDEHFAQLYETENRLSRLLLVATGLAIFIACLGLLALSAFVIQQRTKEIGVRKVLGATTISIVGLLSKDFLKLVLVALLIASPLSYYFMENWLQDFAYRINIELWMFLVAVVMAVLIAFVTVSFQSIRAALMNPVESLRNE